jgi:hypothetical protein
MDWPLVQDGAVTLFAQTAALDATCAELSGIGYKVARVRCREGLDATLADLGSVLRWTEQFGGRRPSAKPEGFPALRDGFQSFPFEEGRRTALAFDGFDKLVSEDARFAISLLDIVETTSRRHLLAGCVLIALVQTDDADFQCPPIGCRVPAWSA